MDFALPNSDRDRKRRLMQMILGQQPDTDQEAGPVGIPTDTPVGLKRLGDDNHPPSITMAPQTDSPAIDQLSQIGEAAKAGQRYGPAAAVLTGSRRAKADAEAFDAAPALPIKGFWRRVGAGLNKGLQTFREGGGPQNLGGLIGAVAGGGGYAAVSKKGIADWQKERSSKQMWNKYGQEIQKEGIEEQRSQGIAKTQGDQMKAVKAGIDAQQAAAEPFIKAASAKGYMTPEEVEHIKTTYGVDVTDPNNGRFDTETRNGKTYIRRVNDPTFVPDPTIPTELGDQYYETALPGQSQKVPLKPGQAASTAVGIAQANAGREERAGNAAARVEERNYESESQFKTRQGKARADAADAQASLTSLYAGREEAIANGTPTTGIDARIADAKGKLAAAGTTLKEKFTPRPTSTPKTLTEGEFRSRYGQGRTEAEIQEALKKGRANGMIR